MLSRTLQQGLTGPDFDTANAVPKEGSPFKSIEVLVVPENVTKLAKVELRPSETPLVEERDLALKRGDTLEGVLKATGHIADDQIRAVVAALGGRSAPPLSPRASNSACRSPRAPSPATRARSPG